MKICIGENEIQYITIRSWDLIGYVFTWNNRIFRRIKAEKKEYVLELFNRGVINELIKENLFVNSWISEEIVIEEYLDDLIIEHEVLPYSSEVSDWTWYMIEECGKAIARANLCLFKYGYELLDTHYYNVMFKGCSPIYIDLGSIVPMDKASYYGMRDFHEYYILPFIYIKKYGKMSIFLKSHFDSNKTFSYKDYLEIQCGKLGKLLYWMGIVFDWGKSNAAYSENIDSEEKIKHLVYNFYKITGWTRKKITRKKEKYYKKYLKKNHLAQLKGSTYWGNYQENIKAERLKDFNHYIDYIVRWHDLEEVHSFLELAGNQGLFSEELVKRTGMRGCCSDYDINAITAGYKRVVKTDVKSKLNFAVLDILSDYGNVNKPAYKRFVSDVLIALAVSHHLLLTQGLKIDALINYFCLYTNKYLITEFMPLGLWSSENPDFYPPVPEWYNLDWFVEKLSNKFDIIEVKEMTKNRIGIIARKIE